MDDMKIYNINVGILGHVDSGKTSLVAAMSEVLSTAALDKHPQSKERGITLDLGFSSTMICPPPPHLRYSDSSSVSSNNPSFDSPTSSPSSLQGLQLTFVDCFGPEVKFATETGSITNKDIQEGTHLLGPDGYPRTVGPIEDGEKLMYEVSFSAAVEEDESTAITAIDGVAAIKEEIIESEKFTCSGGHILCLRIDTPVKPPLYIHESYVVHRFLFQGGKVIFTSSEFPDLVQAEEFYMAVEKGPIYFLMTVEEYLVSSKMLREKVRMYRSGPIDFPATNCPDHSAAYSSANQEEVGWLIGLWLGAGHSNRSILELSISESAQGVAKWEGMKNRLEDIASKMNLSVQIVNPKDDFSLKTNLHDKFPHNVIWVDLVRRDTNFVASYAGSLKREGSSQISEVFTDPNNSFWDVLKRLKFVDEEGRKCIPGALLAHNLKVRQAVVSGFVHALEVSDLERQEFEFEMSEDEKSRLFLSGFVRLFRSVGLPAKLSRRYPIRQRGGSQAELCIKFQGDCISTFSSGITSEQKEGKEGGALSEPSTSVTFQVKEIGIKPYRKWEVDGDGLVLLENFVVGHNCPGHASLIRTVLGGVQITDILVLVVDITKGIQAQTAECLVVGEMATSRMVVALNKIDLIPASERAKAISKAAKKLAKTLKMTRFSGAPIVPVSAAFAEKRGGRGSEGEEGRKRGEEGRKREEEVEHGEDEKDEGKNICIEKDRKERGVGNDEDQSSIDGGIQGLINTICNLVPRPTLDQYPSRTSLSSSSVSTLSSSTSPSSSSTPSPSTSQPILFAFDHCFQVKGHGTVFTGTVLKGSIRVNDTICLPMQNEIRTVKSLQIFRRPAQLAVKGDRVGVCVKNLDPKGIERGILAAPGSVPTFSLALARVDKVRFFTGKIATGSKIHLTIGAHATVVATVACVLGTNDGLGLLSQAAALQALVAGIVSSGEEGDFTSQSSLKLKNDEERHTFSALDVNQNYVWQDELYGLEGRPISNSYRLQRTAQLAAEKLVRERVEQLSISKAKKNKMNKKSMGKDHSASNRSEADGNVNPDNINVQEDETSSQYRHWGPQWILFRFPQPVTAPADAMVIGAKLDVDLGSYGAVSNKSGGGNSKNNYKAGDTSSNKPSGEEKEWSSASDATACRFALYGKIVRIIAEDESTASGIKSGGVSCTNNNNNNNKGVHDCGSGSKSLSTTALFNSVPTFSIIPLSQIKVFKEKIREGSLERILGDSGSISLSNSSAKEDNQSFEAYIGPGVEAIGTGMFKKETDLEIFIGMKVFTGLAEEGEIVGKFGKSSKFRIYFPKGLIAPIEGRSAFARNLYLVAKRKVSLAVGGLGKGAPGSGGSDPKIQLLQFI